MPEIKNNFLKGRINKDLDERLVPSGEYRDALNIEVSTSEGSNVGVVKNILGNHGLVYLEDGFTCVGSIADDKTNKLYWFVSSYEADCIIEYDIDIDKKAYVFVDKHVGTPKAVLKFPNKIITGINIIDNLLLWTDNVNNPRKINIDTCKAGTDISGNQHTQLSFEKGSFNGLTINLITQLGNFSPVTNAVSQGDRVWYEEKQLEAVLGVPPVNPGVASQYHTVKHYRDNEYLGLKNIEVWSDPDPAAGQPGNYFYALQGAGPSLDNSDPWEKGDIIFGCKAVTLPDGTTSYVNQTIDIEERHITVIKPKPLSAPSIKINHSESINSDINIPNIFETKLPRFAYRYKYKDGEVSPFSPFTHPVFNAKYPKDASVSNVTNIFYNKDNAYDVEDAHNKAMVNSIHSIELTEFVTVHTPENVDEIEILYKQEESPVIYSISTIKRSHKDWHEQSSHEGLGEDIGLGNPSTINATYPNGTFKAIGSAGGGKYIVTTENIYAALPENQLLRPWDNVPKKALAQEVTGNRVVYGNYVQNYDLGEDVEISISYNDRNAKINNFESQGLRSIKSQRNYQVGVVYSDKFGRETPVFTSTDGAVNIPWQSDNIRNASRSLQLNTSVANNFPEWVDSLKFFIKETSNQYYNLIMDRAWVTKSTYDLDSEKGNIWISFPSADRNKISEDDYIILKKKIGTGEEQIAFENKFKIIDIQNNAPEACKYQLVNYGQVGQTSDATATDALTIEVFDKEAKRMDKEVDTLSLSHVGWKSFENSGNIKLFGGVPLETEATDINDGPIRTNNLYISWRRLDASGKGVSSKKYKITSGKFGGANYDLKLATKITKIDADIAHVNGDSSTAQSLLHADLIVQIERKELKDDQNFSGKFFVKISKNQITDLVQSGNPVNTLDQFQVTSKRFGYYWQDDIGSSATYNINNVTNYGLTNYDGFTADHTTDASDSIHDSANNTEGDVDANNSALKVTDYEAAWGGIYTAFGGSQFFIDSMYMAAGQSEASNYAKYSCITWSGCTAGQAGSAEESSWSYPPMKTWITDFKNQSGLKKKLKSNSLWWNDDFISTSPLVPAQNDWRNKKVDGWVGPLQKVSRNTPTDVDGNHINGLEGIVTTTDIHANGARRWFSGINTKGGHGVGNDTKTYSNDGEVGRHFMHLSFFAPGRNLHSGTFKDTSPTLFGQNSWAANLQGIWGGGVFTGETKNSKFGSGGTKHRHIMMEGNHDVNNNYRFLAPGPGIGVGYDLKHRELHEKQWDPTYNQNGDTDNKIRDFIRNLHPGAQFRFNKVGDTTDTEVYTIKKVSVKKLYNHTSWRKPFNRYVDGAYKHLSSYALEYKSVEQTALEYLKKVNDSGTYSSSGTEEDDFKTAIHNFGKANNRRICYIIELDKNPVASASGFNPLEASANIMSADVVGNNFCDIEFLDPVKDVLLSDLSKFPAIWELDPKKQEVDLDIYYEASGNLPVKLSETTSELFAPTGCRVEILNSTITTSCILESWNGSTATLSPGFPKYDVQNGVETAIDYSDMSFKFIRKDGSYTVAEAISNYDVPATGQAIKVITEFDFKENIGENLIAGLSWYNCFSFGNGIESNRIRDDYNQIFIANGVKASTTTQEIYKEEHRANSLIYSGIYNSNSGVNDLNQFIMAEKTTKDLNPTFGSIQKLFQRRISLIAFCEDKVISIVSNKDTIFNADANPQLVASDKVLGDANPFSGDYGISKNPESFARESFRTYFTDKQRGAVLRLSKDGLTPISKTGMHDWFRDNLREYNSLIGTYDSYKEDYNLTLSNNSFSQNLLQDAYLEAGGDPIEIADTTNRVLNSVPTGTNFQYPYEIHDILELGTAGVASNPFYWDDFINPNLDTSIYITNHAEIPLGSLIPAVTQTYVTTGVASASSQWGGGAGQLMTDALDDSGGSVPGAIFGSHAEDPLSTTNGNYESITPSIAKNDLNYYPTLDNSGFLIGGGPDANISAHITKNEPGSTNNVANFNYPIPNNPNSTLTGNVSRKAQWKNNQSGIVWDRINTGGYIEWTNIGLGGVHQLGHSYAARGGVNDSYLSSSSIGTAVQTAQGYSANENTDNITHGSCFAGDEIHVQVKLLLYATPKGDGWSTSTTNQGKARFGRNYIRPKLELYDGTNIVGTNDHLTAGGGEIIDRAYTGAYYGVGMASANPEGAFIPRASQLVNGDIIADWDNDGTTRASNSGDVTPYNCFHSTPFGGADGDQGETFYGYTQPINFVDAYSWQNYANVEFSSTKYDSSNTGTSTQQNWTIDDANYDRWHVLGPVGYAHSNGTQDTREYKISFSIKLGKLNGQSYADYLKNGPSPGFGFDEDPITKVVDSLKLRFYGKTSGSPSGNWYDDVGSNWNKLKRPLFKILDVRIKKGFSVVQANIPATTSTTIDVTGVAPVPAVTIPAWREIQHNRFSLPSQTWTLSANAVGTSFTVVGAETSYGDNRAAVPTQGLDSIGNTVNYVVPQGFTFSHDGSTDAQNNLTLWDTGDYTSNDSYSGTVGSAGSTLGLYDRGSDGAVYSSHLESIANDYIEIVSDANTSQTAVDHGLIIEPWVIDQWYLVDIEFDDTYNPNSGNGGLDGTVRILNVAPSGPDFDDGEDISEFGVGKYSGDNVNSHLQMVQTVRTEYGGSGLGSGDGKTVLRGLFKFASNSFFALNPTNYLANSLAVRVVGCENGIRITKIHCKHLDDLPTTGVVADWEENQQSTYNAVHSLSNNVLYYKNNSLAWQVPADQNGIMLYNKWEQVIPFPENIYETEWKFSFTVSPNPITNNFSGTVGGVIAVEESSIFRGFAFNNITDTGNYLLVFDLKQTPTTANWKVYRENLGTPVTESSNVYSTAELVDNLASIGWFASNAGNKIQLFHDVGVGVTAAQEFAISNISFIPVQNTLLGGTIGAWNISNFDSVTNDYITLDSENNYFVFDDCPIYETGETQFININQQISKPVNKNDQYKISFTHEITQGEINIYYYNSEGFGFRIENIGGATAGQPINFEQIVTIGQQDFTPGQGTINSIDYSSTGLNLDSDLTSSFVIVAGDNGSVIKGFIDNISMVKVFVDAGISDKTITFNEAVNGWSSFKSFVPESGVSLSKKYFTFKDGNLWQHYVPKVNGATEYESGEFQIKHKAEEANNYNNFYDNQYGSKVQFVSNQDPSTVKVFNTLNYEGSQTYVAKPLTEGNITINNAIAWSSGKDVSGWKCTEIKTDLDSGSIVEFIKKEGKWFNYIQGDNTQQALDTSRFDVQGIGVIDNATSISFTSATAFSFSSGSSGSVSSDSVSPAPTSTTY